MFGGFSGVSAEEYGRQTGQLPWVRARAGVVVGSGKGPSLGASAPRGPRMTMQRPLARKAMGSTVMTKPMCLCKMQRDGDEARQAPK